jgi:hypothetical protein
MSDAHRGTMTEILTESFCERCGSRYTFESAVPKDRLRKVKVLSRGLKTFVLDDKTSMDEAMAAARSDTDRAVTSSQLDAFHKTFNFCMQCRQYTCPNCWNEAEGRCLTCAPNLSREILPAPFPDLQPANGLGAAAIATNGALGTPAASANGTAGSNGTATNGTNGTNGHAPDDGLYGLDAIARLDALSGYTAPVVAAEAVVAAEPVAADAAVADEPVVSGSNVEPPVAQIAAEPIADVALSEPTLDAVAEPIVEDTAPEPIAGIADDAVATESPVAETAVAEAAAEPTVAEPVADVVAADAVTEPVIEPLDDLVFEADLSGIVPPTDNAIEEVVLDMTPDAGPVVTDQAAEVAPLVAATQAPDLDPDGTDARAAAAAAATSAMFAGLRPGQSLDDAIDAFERDEPAAASAEPLTDLSVATEPEMLAAEPEAVIESADVDLPLVASVPEPGPVAVTEPQPVLAPEAAPEPVVEAAELVAAVPDPAPVVPIVEPEPEPVAAEPVAAAPEPEPAPVAAEPAPIAAIAPLVAAELVVAPEPAVVTPQSPAAAPAVEPIAATVATEPELVIAAPPADVVAQPTWTIVAPDPTATNGAAAPAPTAEPQWPTTPQWPSQKTSPGLPFLGRPAVPTGGVDALWAASDQAVTATPGNDRAPAVVQACVSCGLSLSATARFCRRCGTAQHA